MRKHSSWLLIFAGVVLVAMALAAPANAHHGWGSYQEEQFEITGTLESPVSFAGPHATTKLRVNEEVWDVVLAPSLRTARAGLNEDTIPVGAEVTASGHRHLDAAELEIKTERLTWNGKVFDVYPDRN
jgi:hypothetical protein